VRAARIGHDRNVIFLRTLSCGPVFNSLESNPVWRVGGQRCLREKRRDDLCRRSKNEFCRLTKAMSILIFYITAVPRRIYR